jgi:hypothetical protein
MAGLRKILKMSGSMKVNGVRWMWDYAKDEPRIESEMTKEERRESEKAKWSLLRDKLTPPDVAHNSEKDKEDN